MFTSIDGDTEIFEHFAEDVDVETPVDAPDHAFRFEIPGIADVDQERIRSTLPEVSFSAHWTGEHTPYWAGPNPAASPYAPLGPALDSDTQWFLVSLGTPAAYAYQDARSSHRGNAIAHFDKRWYANQGQGSGFAYVMAVSEKHKLMLLGAMNSVSATEMWVGRYLSDQVDLTLLSTLAGINIRRSIDSCGGEIRIDIRQERHRLVVRGRADVPGLRSVGGTGASR